MLFTSYMKWMFIMFKMMCNRYEEQQQTKRVFLASYSTRRVYTPFDKLVTSIVSTNWRATKRILLKYLCLKIIISFVRIESSSKIALHRFSVNRKDFFARKNNYNGLKENCSLGIRQNTLLYYIIKLRVQLDRGQKPTDLDIAFF